VQSFMKPVTLVFLLIVAGVVLAAEPEWRFPSDQITPEQLKTFRSEVVATLDLERKDFANQLVLNSTKERKVWVFTLPNHPAHPAVVVWAIVARGTGSQVKRMGHYAGDPKAFDRWLHEFGAVDALPGQVR
jgi:hypothetical protein